MPRRFRLLAWALPLAMGDISAFAQTGGGALACTAPADLPASLASWPAAVPMKAAADRNGLDAARLTPGQAVQLMLLQTSKVAFPLQPKKPGGTASYGGLMQFAVKEEGVWRVALGSGAWIDVVKDGKALPSIAHGHGPACSGIRKMVDFSLSPGTYILQVAASGTETLTVMAAHQP